MIVLFILVIFFGKITGKAVNSFGPSQSDVSCMMTCMGCSSPGVGCTGNQQECQAKCNVYKPEQSQEESCVESCTKQGCGEYDFSCQEKNQAVCDKQCGMVKEPEAKSEEEQCIRDCVKAQDADLICKPGEGGEQGSSICQSCAKSCEHLYSGPCLTEIKLEEAKSACNTCEHCYGKPVMGDSGEGYECIVSIECADSSSEFGDNPGEGPGISQEGFIAKAGESISNAIEAIGSFFSDLF